MDKNKDIALKFAKENGYDTVTPCKGKKWNGQPLYFAKFYNENNMIIGLPSFIIVDSERTRFANRDETRKIMGLVSRPVEFTESLEDYL